MGIIKPKIKIMKLFAYIALIGAAHAQDEVDMTFVENINSVGDFLNLNNDQKLMLLNGVASSLIEGEDFEYNRTTGKLEMINLHFMDSLTGENGGDACQNDDLLADVLWYMRSQGL